MKNTRFLIVVAFSLASERRQSFEGKGKKETRTNVTWCERGGANETVTVTKPFLRLLLKM
jgi:hypothetical protein